jgi:hypothetical protein
MVRGPSSGDIARSSVYYLGSAGPGSAGLGSAGLGSAGPGSAGPGSAGLGSAGLGSAGPGSAVPGSPRSRPPALDGGDPLAPGALALEPDPGTGGGWSGAGGRWLLWPLRVVLWATLLVIAFRGVTAIVFDSHSASPAASPRPADAKVPAGQVPAGQVPASQFPVSLAEAYAAEFGQVYLNFSPQTQGQREQLLADFLPASVAAANPNLGWNGTGQLSLQAERVVGITVQDPQHAVVTLLATVNGQLMELGVPVAASGGGVVVSGEPAWLPAPVPVTLPSAVPGRSDPVAQSQLMNVLPQFFQAYASGDSAAISQFTPKGVSLTGLGGAVAFDSIAALVVPSGGTTGQVSVTVIWRLAGQTGDDVAKIEMTYRMSVVALQSGKWYVKEVSASTEAVGGR